MNHVLERILTPLDSTLRDVLRVIDRGAQGVAFLVDNETNTFKGLVTDGDVRRALLKGASLEETVVSSVELSKAVTVKTGTSFNKILELFSPAVRVIPILDENDNIVDVAVYDKRRFFPIAEPQIDEKEWQYVSDCVLSGWVSSNGKYVKQFEDIFADFCTTKYGVSTSSGTTALHLALLAGNVGVGDEVIVPSLTFIATANAVRYVGATPVFADSEIATWNLDSEKLESLITKKTKAIIPVHLYGQPVNMKPIMELADTYNLLIIEDAAEAHGAEYKGQKVGSIGHIGVFSFYGNKIVTTGEGGMVVTSDSEIAQRVRILRDHGMDPERRYYHTVLGYNYRMTNLQAALGVGQMEKIDTILLKKRRIAAWYRTIFSEIKGITFPEEAPWGKSVYWLSSILIDKERFSFTRDELIVKLKDRGIETRPVFYPVHRQPVYDLDLSLPVAERISFSGISLPSSPKLEKESVFEIGECIVNLLQEERV